MVSQILLLNVSSSEFLNLITEFQFLVVENVRTIIITFSMLKWTSLQVTQQSRQQKNSFSVLDTSKNIKRILPENQFTVLHSSTDAITLPRYEGEEYSPPICIGKSSSNHHRIDWNPLIPDPLRMLQSRYLYNSPGIIVRRASVGGEIRPSENDQSLEEFIDVILNSARKSTTQHVKRMQRRRRRRITSRKHFAFKRLKRRILKFELNKDNDNDNDLCASSHHGDGGEGSLSPSYTACQDPARDLSLSLYDDDGFQGQPVQDTSYIQREITTISDGGEWRIHQRGISLLPHFPYKTGEYNHSLSEVGVALPSVYV